MNKLVYSALALTLVSVPGLASENEWSSLDQEIATLSSSLSAQNTGPKIGGWVISSWRFSGDLDQDPSPTEESDQSGFQLDTVRVEITGDAGSGYSYKVSFDVADDFNGSTLIKDAYATWKIGDVVTGKMGRFKQPFLRSGLLSDNRLLFLDRTALGSIFSARDQGIQFSGQFDTIDWHVAGQNGRDGMAEDYLFTGRVEANLMGAGVGKVEGAYGAGEETNLSIGAAVADDGSLDDGMHWTVDAYLTTGPFAVAGEIVDFDDGDDATSATPGWGTTDPILGNMVGGGGLGTSDIADSTPWDVTASYMFSDMYEVAFRYEDADNTEDTTSWRVGVNRYTQGHDIKWQVQYVSIDSDTTATNVEGDIDQFALGLVVSF